MTQTWIASTASRVSRPRARRPPSRRWRHEDLEGQTQDGTFAVEFHLRSPVRSIATAAMPAPPRRAASWSDATPTTSRSRSSESDPAADGFGKRGRSGFVRGVSGLSEMLGKRWRARADFLHRRVALPSRQPRRAEWRRLRADDPDQPGQRLRLQRAATLILGASKCEGQRIFRAFVYQAEEAPMELHRAAERVVG